MIGALIAFALLAFAFAAGYATRAFVSQRRRTRYLLYQPYLPRGTRVEADARGDDLASLPAEQHWTCRTQPPVPLRQLPIKMALTNCSGGWSAKPTGLGGTSHPWIGLAWHYLTTLTHSSPTQGASRVPRRDRHETIFRNGEIILKPTAVYQEGLVLAYRVSSMVEVVAALLGLCSAGIFLAHAVEAYSTR